MSLSPPLTRTWSADTIETWCSSESLEDVELDLESADETATNNVYANNTNNTCNLKDTDELASSHINKKENDGRSKQADRHLCTLTSALKVLVAALFTLGLLFLLVVHIGARHQADRTFRLLGPAQQLLYSGFLEGEVCAFDDRGPRSNIMTFANKDAAHAADFKVLHCGACGACSTWENLRIEWATRNYLAAESARCAKKSLNGGEGAVTSCLEQPPVAFQGECARCWTRAIDCTKRNCAFIFLQSQLLDTAGNYHVAEGSVTSAVCEEAHCELEDGPGSGRMGFAECSGATRRRMDIVSSIERPEWQQCSIVDVDYAELFGECCNSPRDFHDMEPQWQMLDDMGLVWRDMSSHSHFVNHSAHI